MAVAVGAVSLSKYFVGKRNGRYILTEKRTLLGWSQQRLADELRVSRQAITSIEHGRFNPSLPPTFRMAPVFELRIENLFFLN